VWAGVHSLMMRLVERRLARRFKKGTYIIERRAVEEVLFEGVDMTAAEGLGPQPPFLNYLRSWVFSNTWSTSRRPGNGAPPMDAYTRVC
jgi:hypothetical protein